MTDSRPRREHEVDQQVRASLEDLFLSADPALTELLASRLKDVSRDELRASLQRCELRLGFPVRVSVGPAAAVPTPTQAAPASPKPTPAKAPAKKKAPAPTRAAAPAANGSPLKDLIDAGVLKAPVGLVKEFKGHRLSARVERDGSVTWSGKRFESLSQAAAAARASVVGKNADGDLPPTNGWTFWRLTGPDGKLVVVDEFRQARSAR
jgi:hypothetical protein